MSEEAERVPAQGVPEGRDEGRAHAEAASVGARRACALRAGASGAEFLACWHVVAVAPAWREMR